MLHICKGKKNVLTDSQLLLKISEVIEFMTGIEFLIILSVTSLYFAVVPGRIGTNQFMMDAELS